MAEIGIVEYFIMGEAVGIVATLFVGFYYSRKQMQKLSVNIETKILNDLDDKLHGVSEMAISEPELAGILDRDAAKWGSKVGLCDESSTIILVCLSHAPEERVKR